MELAEHLASHYPALGRARELVPLRFDFKVSNDLFSYVTDGGRFLVKSIADARALYGQQRIADRLELLGRAVFELGRAGLPVERIVPSAGDRFVLEREGTLVRVYRFDPGRPFRERDADLARAARSIARLHREGLAALSPETRAGMQRFELFYPLAETAKELPALFEFSKDFGFTDRWPLIEWALEAALSHRPHADEAECFVHIDFHPKNALFSDDREEATMIDFDESRIDRRFQCLGFSILRFGFAGVERTPETLRAAIAIFAAEDQSRPGFLEDLVHAMIHVEVHKILRILTRVRTTGQYASFIPNIPAIHLENLRVIRAIFGE